MRGREAETGETWLSDGGEGGADKGLLRTVLVSLDWRLEHSAELKLAVVYAALFTSLPWGKSVCLALEELKGLSLLGFGLNKYLFNVVNLTSSENEYLLRT